MKLEANIEAVILRQSAQWQMNVDIKPGAWVVWITSDVLGEVGLD